MSRLSAEMAISQQSEHDRIDELAREELKRSSRPIEQRIDQDYYQHIQELLLDLQQDYEVEEINAFDHGEYCVILKDKNTDETRAYGFEMPLNVSLSPKTDDNNAERAAELSSYLTQIITSKK